MSKHTTYPVVLTALLIAGVIGVMRLEAQRDDREVGAEVAGQPAAEPKLVGLTEEERKELQRRIENTVRERGTVESAFASTLTSPLPGTATIIRLEKEGAHVQKGDVVVELDSSAIRDKLNAQEIEVAKADARLKRAKLDQTAGGRQSEAATAAAKKAVEVAKLARKKWQEEHALELEVVKGEIRTAETRMKAARARMNAGGKGMIEARAAIDEAETALKIGTARRKLLMGAAREFESATRDLEILRSEAELLEITQRTRAEVSAANAALRQAESELLLAKQRYEGLKRQMAQCRLRAPRDGRIVYSHQRTRRAEAATIEEGATVRERQPIVQVVDFSKLQLRVRVHESQIKRVKKGQKVALRFDALADRKLQGTVRTVINVPRRGEWPKTDVTYFTVIVSIDQPDAGLKIGMTGEAEIDVSKASR